MFIILPELYVSLGLTVQLDKPIKADIDMVFNFLFLHESWSFSDKY